MMNSVKRRILEPQQEEWLASVREQMQRLLAALGRVSGFGRDQGTVRDQLRQLDELFLLVVVGEFNSGKSAFINALAGAAVLEEGVVPTTSKIQILQYGEGGAPTVLDDGRMVVTAPIEFLRDSHIVDTPGTNAIERRHEAITQEFIPRADLILFVTSADRPFTESERTFLQRIRDWGKKIVFVINKIDILETEADVARVEQFVRENARVLLGVDPELFSVSARTAFRAKQDNNEERYRASRFDALERYITGTLDAQEQVRLKLLSPIGVGRHLTEKHLTALGGQSEVLAKDLETIREIEGHLALYSEDLERDFQYRLADVDNILHQMEARGHAFIEDLVRLPRLFDLMNKEKTKADFEKRVVADAPAEIERRVDDIIDWLVSSDLQQWQFLKDQIARRRSDRSREAIGEVASGFDYDRSRLVESVGRAAQRTLESFDKQAEASRMADSVQEAVAGTALMEVGAVGLGTVVTLVATTTAADVTGLLAAGVLATVGLLVIPNKRRTAKKELHEKIAALREQLMTALRSQFSSEGRRRISRLQEGIAPYTRFVRAEERHVAAKREEFTAIETAMARLRAVIESPR